MRTLAAVTYVLAAVTTSASNEADSVDLVRREDRSQASKSVDVQRHGSTVEDTMASATPAPGAPGSEFNDADQSTGPEIPTAVADADDPAKYAKNSRGLFGYSDQPQTSNIVTKKHTNEVVLDGTKLDNCPWLDGASTGTNSMLCWDATTCDPSEKGDACCYEHGGVLQCPQDYPNMCNKKNCGGDHCCAVDCSLQGGLRQCIEGPVGSPGAPGKIGPPGKRGLEGKAGVEGPDGKYGKPGPPGEPGPEGPAAPNGPPRSAASRTLVVAVSAVNAVMAVGVYILLKFLYNHQSGKAAPAAGGAEEWQGEW